MTKLISRLRTAMSTLGNEGAVANVVSELARAAAARHAVDELEARIALAVDVPLPDAA